METNKDKYTDYSMDEMKELAKYLAKEKKARLVKYFVRVRHHDDAVLGVLLRYKDGAEMTMFIAI
jgi:hypothetical protein